MINISTVDKFFETEKNLKSSKLEPLISSDYIYGMDVESYGGIDYVSYNLNSYRYQVGISSKLIVDSVLQFQIV